MPIKTQIVPYQFAPVKNCRKKNGKELKTANITKMEMGIDLESMPFLEMNISHYSKAEICFLSDGDFPERRIGRVKRSDGAKNSVELRLRNQFHVFIQLKYGFE